MRRRNRVRTRHFVHCLIRLVEIGGGLYLAAEEAIFSVAFVIS